jgi:L-rhamnose mutarotase
MDLEVSIEYSYADFSTQLVEGLQTQACVHTETRRNACMKRYGSVINVRSAAIEEYKRYHAAVWPEILEMIHRCNIRNYSIFLKDDLLFGYFEYHGNDFAADMAKMAADPKTQEWWAVMKPMQQPLETRREGEWWAVMEEVFHTD